MESPDPFALRRCANRLRKVANGPRMRVNQIGERQHDSLGCRVCNCRWQFRVGIRRALPFKSVFSSTGLPQNPSNACSNCRVPLARLGNGRSTFWIVLTSRKITKRAAICKGSVSDRAMAAGITRHYLVPIAKPALRALLVAKSSYPYRYNFIAEPARVNSLNPRCW